MTAKTAKANSARYTVRQPRQPRNGARSLVLYLDFFPKFLGNLRVVGSVLDSRSFIFESAGSVPPPVPPPNQLLGECATSPAFAARLTTPRQVEGQQRTRRKQEPDEERETKGSCATYQATKSTARIVLVISLQISFLSETVSSAVSLVPTSAGDRELRLVGFCSVLSTCL